MNPHEVFLPRGGNYFTATGLNSAVYWMTYVDGFVLATFSINQPHRLAAGKNEWSASQICTTRRIDTTGSAVTELIEGAYQHVISDPGGYVLAVDREVGYPSNAKYLSGGILRRGRRHRGGVAHWLWALPILPLGHMRGPDLACSQTCCKAKGSERYESTANHDH
ncbi:hypothetical protein GCM10028828_11810 [Corynebacterium tapiri]